MPGRPVPEVRGHWLLGSARAIAGQPHTFVSDVARRHGGIAKFRILHKEFFATGDPDHAQHILIAARDRYRRAFQARNIALVTGDGLLASEGEGWESHRRLIQPVLHGDHVRKLVPVVRDSTREMMERWAAAEGPVDAVAEMQRLTIQIIVRTLFSFTPGAELAARLGEATREAALLIRKRNLSLLQTPVWMPLRDNRLLQRHCRFIADFVASRIDVDGDNLLTALRDAADPRTGERFSRDALIDETRTLLLAGFETTAASLAWTLYLLARHPEAAKLWREETDRVLGGRAPEWDDLPRLRFTAAVVNESLRLYPPVYTLPRRCVHDDDLGGYAIPKSAIVLVSIYGIHRSACWGDDAESFVPERFASSAWPRRAFLPFGMGKHLCAGNQFALAEIVTILACLAQQFRISPVDDEPVEPRAQVTLVPSGPILLRAEPR